MKSLTIILLLCSINCFCQIKCKYEVNEKDSFSGDRRIITKPYSIGKFEGMNKNLFAYACMVNDVYFLRFYSTLDMGCASSQSAVSFKDNNNIIYEQQHFGDIDCGKTVSAYSSVPPHVMVLFPDTLQDKSFTMIRVQFEKWGNVILDRQTIIKELCDCIDVVKAN